METLFLLMKETRAKKIKVIIYKICSGVFLSRGFWLGGFCPGFLSGGFVLVPHQHNRWGKLQYCEGTFSTVEAVQYSGVEGIQYTGGTWHQYMQGDNSSTMEDIQYCGRIPSVLWKDTLSTVGIPSVLWGDNSSTCGGIASVRKFYTSQ